ncbi:hypothetical protein BpHYR1_048591 [Brachionus plicatilis]|uniref:Uncharacterized protein n=1 Tax=Brachionus plicatilis TaxID=10195 RepID=A0A3M7RV78_BRAPC|nr:hypothetical protein BpHYR1_048591 [Brachionus plicatilis]
MIILAVERNVLFSSQHCGANTGYTATLNFSQRERERKCMCECACGKSERLKSLVCSPMCMYTQDILNLVYIGLKTNVKPTNDDHIYSPFDSGFDEFIT